MCHQTASDPWAPACGRDIPLRITAQDTSRMFTYSGTAESWQAESSRFSLASISHISCSASGRGSYGEKNPNRGKVAVCKVRLHLGWWFGDHFFFCLFLLTLVSVLLYSSRFFRGTEPISIIYIYFYICIYICICICIYICIYISMSISSTRISTCDFGGQEIPSFSFWNLENQKSYCYHSMWV